MDPTLILSPCRSNAENVVKSLFQMKINWWWDLNFPIFTLLTASSLCRYLRSWRADDKILPESKHWKPTKSCINSALKTLLLLSIDTYISDAILRFKIYEVFSQRSVKIYTLSGLLFDTRGFLSCRNRYCPIKHQDLVHVTLLPNQNLSTWTV